MGRDLWAAVALMLVLEGILPFAHPALWRRMVLEMARLSDAALRMAGLASMLAGLLLLALVR
ncbi:MAG: DUF2065 family protein [Gammaproteobacteria bacterium]|nr:MAG: DUF2065 family protein [Gammaproteobacteria bacterium]